jgi:hypothetical protein
MTNSHNPKEHHRIVFGLRRAVRRQEYWINTQISNKWKLEARRRRHRFLKLLLEYQILTFNRW